MFYCKCINKIRDKNNIIESYELIDLNGNIKVVDKELLKAKIKDNSVIVTNLVLTKDNKLVARSVVDEQALMRRLTNNKLSTSDERLIKKAKIMGIAPTVSNNGKMESLPDSNTIHITPDIKHVNYIEERDKKVVLHGNNELLIQDYILAKEIDIYNSTVLHCLTDHRISADKIFISTDTIDVKTLDFIFKVMKTAIDASTSFEDMKKILIDANKLDKEQAFNRMKAILKRQKPSAKLGRRAYDLAIYMQFQSCLALSYRDKIFLDGVETYYKEFDILTKRYNFGSSYNSDTKYIEWIVGNLAMLNKLLKEAQEI